MLFYMQDIAQTVANIASHVEQCRVCCCLIGCTTVKNKLNSVFLPTIFHSSPWLFCGDGGVIETK